MRIICQEAGKREVKTSLKSLIPISITMLGAGLVENNFYLFGLVVMPVGIGLFIAELHKDYHATTNSKANDKI